jgi:hypothetical protein
MKMGPEQFPQKNNLEQDPVITSVDFSQNLDTLSEKQNNGAENLQGKYIKIPLTEEEKKLSAKELSEKYNTSYTYGYVLKEKGYRLVDNPNFESTKQKIGKETEFLKEITNLNINSIETVLGNENEQKIVKDIVSMYDSKYKHWSKEGKNYVDSKKFKFLSGAELGFGDFVILNRLIELKAHRDTDGTLVVFDISENKFVPFRPTRFFDSHQTVSMWNISNQDKNYTHIPLESYAPYIFKSGFFKEGDFNKRIFGSGIYDVAGAHERKLTPTAPYVFFSNENGSAKYYLGREKFVGTDDKINHDITKVILLDNETAAIIEDVHGKRNILYTFNLMDKNTYENKKQEVIDRRTKDNKKIDINFSDYITEKPILNKYSITKFFNKKQNETDEKYAERISKYSDLSYVLNKFRSFLSETGLAANNYSWKDQLVLAGSLTSVKESEKIVGFSKVFGKNGLRTFLSVEQGGKEMGDKILKLGEKLPEDVAREIFKKYGEMIDRVDEVTEVLKQKLNFTEKSTDSEDAIKNNLLLRAKNLLEKYADDLNKNPKEILEEIEKIKVENVLTLSIFQSLHETKGIRFEDMKDFSFSYESQLNEDEEKEGEDIINKNYKDAPQEAREAILSSFKIAVNQKDKDINFPNLKYKGKMVSFMQLNFAKYKGSEDYGKKVYFGSFNVDPDFANGEIGSAMMERTVDNVAKTHIVEADCNAEQNIGAKYIESGFTAVDFYNFKGLPGFKIIRDDKMKDKFIGKNLSKEEIISMLDNGSKKEGFDIISASQQKDFLPEFKKVLNSTKIISRYFYDKNTKRWIVVVESNLFSKKQV